MSETPTEPTTEEVNEERQEQRRVLSLQVAAGLTAQRSEGIVQMLNYAEALEKYLSTGENSKADFEEEHGPLNPR